MLNKILIKELGLDEAAILAMLLDKNAQHGDEFFVTADTAHEMLNLGRRPYDSAIATLKEKGLITTYLKGVPPKTYFVINFDTLGNYFQFVQNGQLNLYGEDNLICTERTTNNNKDNNNKDNNIINIEELDDGFEEAWALYGRKGSKVAAKQYWRRLSKADREAIMRTIPIYLAAKPDEKFRKDFSGWINPAYRRWEDKIVGEVAAPKSNIVIV